jgi:GTP1/Obg family GTP-binding protein
MRTQIASRLARLEQKTGMGSRRIVVVEDQKALEAARAFLQGRPDVDMDRITFVITGVPRSGQGPEDWLRAACGC